VRNDLRVKTGVALIRPEDEGLGLGAVPVGYYGFAVNFGGPVPLTGPEQWVERTQSAPAFEVHRSTTGKFYLIGFIDDATAEKIRKLQSDVDIDIPINNRFSDSAPRGIAVRSSGHVNIRRANRGRVGSSLYQVMVGLRLP
jgi:hypothetical protein